MRICGDVSSSRFSVARRRHCRTIQAQERVRRVAVLMSTTSDEPESQARITALAQGLQEAGWAVGSNVRIDVRWSGGDLARVRKDAEELVALAPDVLVAGIGPTTQAFQETTRTLPIVFTQAVDPVGLGTVKSMARPGGNATGFTQFEYSLSAKWLELLREVVPRVTRVGVVRDGRFAVGLGQWAVIGAAAAPVGVEILPVDLTVTGDTEGAFGEFARGPNDGLIVGVGTAATIQRKSRRRVGSSTQAACRVSLPLLRRGRWPDIVRTEPDRSVPPLGQLRRSHSQGREASRPAGAGTDQVRAGHQSQDRQGARPRHAANGARARRRGDRVIRREFITLIGGARQLGRSQRAPNNLHRR